jgi:diketogulonate reductase-like aldo/keto reductase
MGAALTTSGRLRLLETAYDHGIHHFDTAPLYGQGLAESLLGRFARSRRDSLTITTKFGLLPHQRPALLRPLLPLARVINRRLLIPLRQRPPAATRAPAPPPARGAALGPAPLASAPARPAVPYTAAMLRSQLERSLRQLDTDYIDYYLLHECHCEYLNSDVLDCLEALVREGKIRHYGIGSGRWQSRRILEEHGGVPWVVQIPDGWADRDTDWFCQRSTPWLFTHSSLRLCLEGGAPSAEGLCQRWAQLTDQDPRQPGLLSGLLLTMALERNPLGCVVFSSRHANHIRHNTQLLDLPPAHRLAAQQLIQEASDSIPCPSG